jgi:hypothetical protein
MTRVHAATGLSPSPSSTEVEPPASSPYALVGRNDDGVAASERNPPTLTLCRGAPNARSALGELTDAARQIAGGR